MQRFTLFRDRRVPVTRDKQTIAPVRVVQPLTLNLDHETLEFDVLVRVVQAVQEQISMPLGKRPPLPSTGGSQTRLRLYLGFVPAARVARPGRTTPSASSISVVQV